MDRSERVKKLFIWGAGEIGKRILKHLGKNWEVTFVDSNKKLAGSYFEEREVIGIEEYIEKYNDEFILVAHLQENESIQFLKKSSIVNYFIHCDLPGEFKEPFVRDSLKEYILGYFKGKTHYILYGLGLYSIIIDDWLYEVFGVHPYILVQKNISQEALCKIKKKYKGLMLINNIKQLDVKEVCVCTDNYNEIKKNNIFSEYCLTDVFDCTDRIKSYHNVAIERFHNIHKGERGFIVATGPSLSIEDLNVLKENKEVCISMNSIFYLFDKTDWRPDYYVMSDHRGFDLYKGMLDNLPVNNIFLSDNSDVFWNFEHKENIYCHHHHYEYYFNRLPKFSDDFSKRTYTGSTVTYNCMQLAAYMGFKEIYLLGVDFSYGGQKKNETYAHFYKEEKTTSVGFVDQVTLAYQSAKQYADLHGFKIYNATRGGKLEIFERVDFDNIF